MLTDYKIERSFYRLEQNLFHFDFVVGTYEKMFKNSWEHLRNNLPEVVESYKEIYGAEELEYSHVKNSRIIEYGEFSENFQNDFGFKPLTVSFFLDKKDWKKFRKIVDHKNSLAFFCRGRHFARLPASSTNNYLTNLGLIFLIDQQDDSGNLDTLEHEILHSCLDKYSRGLPNLIRLGLSSDYEFHHMAHVLEARLMDEASSFQIDLKRQFRSTSKLLLNHYFKKDLPGLKDLLGKKSRIVKRLDSYISDRIRYDLKYVRKFFNSIPSHIANPLFYGIGPTPEDLKQFNTSSPIDDIIIWSEMVMDEKLLKKAKKVLKSKGYSI